MGLVGLLKFAFDLLAWPLIGLGCPLYASIRAIENNSNSEMRNLVAYWIIFSLVSLFELAFVKLIDWLPFWPYLKLMAMCLLVLPDFYGASYVYECLLRPCLSVDLQAAIKYFIKPKDEKNLDAKSILAAVDRYIQENGCEALEKLLDQKSEHTKPDIGMEVMKAITYTEEKETAARIQSKYEQPNVGEVDARPVELPEGSSVAATKISKEKQPCVDKENANVGELKDESPAVATEKVQCLVPNPVRSEKKMFVAGEINEKTVTAAGGEKNTFEIADSQKVQREWTCALCQVTTTSEKNLDMHLYGKKHKDKCQELKASKQVNKTQSSSSSAATLEPVKSLSVDRSNECRTKNLEDKVQVNQTMDRFELCCTLCNVKLLSEIDVNSHFRGKRHLSKAQQCVFCTLCNVKLLSEIDVNSHFRGKRHLSKAQQCVF